MKNMKTLSLTLAAVVLMAGSALAAKNPSLVETPNNQHNMEGHPLNVGYLHSRWVNSSGENAVCSGRCLLAAIIVNTGPLTSMVTLRNTSVANATGAIVLRHKYTVQNSVPGANPIAFPILLDKGITVTINNAGEEEVTVLYRDLD